MRKITALSVLIGILCSAALYAVPIHVITTGDTHGWITPQTTEDGILGGTAQMLSYWRKNEAYRPERYLVISAGDNATGPAMSTAFKGDPAISIMNLMGYDVSSVGNHEFDFTVDKLIDWKKSARFPFVAANIQNKDGSQVSFALPFVFNEEQGVKIAIIGLTTAELQKSTNNAKPYVLIPYTDALRETVKKVKNLGAQVLIVAAHVPQEELIKLADEVQQLGIPLMIGGHSHELAQRKVGTTWVVNNGQWWESYSRIDMDYNPKTGRTMVLSSKQVYLSQQKPKVDSRVIKEISNWQKKMDSEYGTAIGYTSAGLTRIPSLYNFVADTYLAFDSTADFAILNYGSLRQDWTSGDITKGTVLSLMPFTNTLLKVKLTGSQFTEFVVKAGGLGVSGFKKEGDRLVSMKTGSPLEPDRIYSVLMPNFIYETTDSLMAADPAAVKMADDWRTPVYQWFEKNKTNKDHPLEKQVDSIPRM